MNEVYSLLVNIESYIVGNYKSSIVLVQDSFELLLLCEVFFNSRLFDFYWQKHYAADLYKDKNKYISLFF